MTAILATSGAIRSLVDGTLRLTVDIDPKDAQEAFALFGRPGSPVALARITNDAAVQHDRKAQAQPPAETLDRKPLSLASKVALTCGQRSFADFLKQSFPAHWQDAIRIAERQAGPAYSDEDAASIAVRQHCGVKSRREIVRGSDAERNWLSMEASYHHWQRTGAVA